MDGMGCGSVGTGVAITQKISSIAHHLPLWAFAPGLAEFIPEKILPPVPSHSISRFILDLILSYIIALLSVHVV